MFRLGTPELVWGTDVACVMHISMEATRMVVVRYVRIIFICKIRHLHVASSMRTAPRGIEIIWRLTLLKTLMAVSLVGTVELSIISSTVRSLGP